MGGKNFSLLRTAVDVRPGEWLMTALMSLNLFLVISTFAVVKPARSSLFLQQYGASKLPYVYIATVVLAGAIALLHGWLFRRFSALRVQLFTYLFFISNLLFFWWAFRLQSAWLAAAFFLWVNVFTVTLNTLFWILANNYYNSREAKRLYGLINSGGTIGGIVSGFVVAQIVIQMGTENLLLVCAAVLGISILLTFAIYRQGKERFAAQEYSYVGKTSEAHPAESKPEPEQQQSLFATPYPKYIALALGCALVISMIVDFQFNVVIERTYATKDAKTAFFSSFFAWVNVLTFVLQFFLTGALLRRLGIGVALLILPITMFVGSTIFPFFPVLATIVFLRLSDASVRYSIEQSTRDVLYLPIPKLRMKRLKAFIDVFIQRAAKGVGSLLILALTSWLAFDFSVLSYVAIGLAGLWAVVAVLLRNEYLNELRRFLRRADLREEDRIIRHLDQATTTELLVGLESGDEDRALYCLELLERAQTVDLRLILRSWVRSGTPARQAAALHRLGEVEDRSLISEAERILAAKPTEATEGAIHYLCATNAEGPISKMQEILEIPDPGVHSAALACMVNHGESANQREVEQELTQLIHQTGPQALEGRLLAARTLRHIQPPSTLHSLLIPLLQDKSPEVVEVALKATEKVLRRDLVPLIILHLGNPATSQPAVQALKAHGEGILGTLSDYLGDKSIPLDIRCKLPQVLAEIGSRRGVRNLVSCLSQEERKLRGCVIKALSKLRMAHPDLRIREGEIRKAILREVREAYAFLSELNPQASQAYSVRRKEPEEVSEENRKQRYHQSMQMIFRLLGLLYTPRDISNAYRGLRSPRADVRASAIEFLDNLLPANLRRWTLPLVDDSLSVEEKLQFGARLAH